MALGIISMRQFCFQNLSASFSMLYPNDILKLFMKSGMLLPQYLTQKGRHCHGIVVLPRPNLATDFVQDGVFQEQPGSESGSSKKQRKAAAKQKKAAIAVPISVS